MKPSKIDKVMRDFKKIKIKPCPFCGCEPLFIANEGRIVCPGDGHNCVEPSTGYHGRWSNLVREWNKRI